MSPAQSRPARGLETEEPAAEDAGLQQWMQVRRRDHAPATCATAQPTVDQSTLPDLDPLRRPVSIAYDRDGITIHHGDCLDVLAASYLATRGEDGGTLFDLAELQHCI